MEYNEFTNETLHIFTLVTGPYKKFFEKFIGTIGNFFPDNNKVIHVASDGLDEYNGFCNDSGIIDVDVKHIIDLPFPLIPIQKTYMQKNYVTEDMHYVFYFDIDTIFLGKNTEVWENMFNIIEDGSIIMSKHPHHDAHPEYVWNLVEMNPDSKAYIPEEYNEHVISSFWGGKRESVLNMCDKVNAMFKYDLKNVRYLPKFVDENYINKIIWDTKNGNLDDIKFYCNEHLMINPGTEFSVESPNIFILQKYDLSIKNSKKIVE